jgi:hypothetical protein
LVGVLLFRTFCGCLVWPIEGINVAITGNCDGDNVGSMAILGIGLDVGSSIVIATGAFVFGTLVAGANVDNTNDGKLVDGIEVVGSEVLALGLPVGFIFGSGEGSRVLGFNIGIVNGLDAGLSVTTRVGLSVVGSIVTGVSVFGCPVGKSLNGTAVFDGFPGPACGCSVGGMDCCGL